MQWVLHDLGTEKKRRGQREGEVKRGCERKGEEGMEDQSVCVLV